MHSDLQAKQLNSRLKEGLEPKPIARRGYSTPRGEYRNFETSQSQSGPNWTALVIGGALAAIGAYIAYEAYDVNRQGSLRALPVSGNRDSNGVRVMESVTIDKPRSELYEYWRDFKNLPQIMTHLERVDVKDDIHSHWVAKAPLGTVVEWDATIIQDSENSSISWRSGEDTFVPNEGSVIFQDAPGGRGTEVHVRLIYHPPLGQIGATFAKLFGEEPSLQIAQDLRRYKQKLETGEVASTKGQPQGAS